MDKKFDIWALPMGLKSIKTVKLNFFFESVIMNKILFCVLFVLCGCAEKVDDVCDEWISISINEHENRWVCAQPYEPEPSDPEPYDPELDAGTQDAGTPEGIWTDSGPDAEPDASVPEDSGTEDGGLEEPDASIPEEPEPDAGTPETPEDAGTEWTYDRAVAACQNYLLRANCYWGNYYDMCVIYVNQFVESPICIERLIRLYECGLKQLELEPYYAGTCRNYTYRVPCNREVREAFEECY